MGLSLSDLNPAKAIKSGFGAITGATAAEDAIKAANRTQQQSLADALSALQAGDSSAIERLMSGSKDVLGAINTGFGQGIESFGQIANLFNPEGIRQGLTLEGLSGTINQITDPSGIFSELIGDRQSAANANLSSAGLRRSGAAAESAAAIPLELALGISDTLFSRNVNNPALGAIGNIANLQVGQGTAQGNVLSDLTQSLAGIDLSGASNEANIITGQGAAQAQTQLGLGQLDAAQNAGLFDLFGGPAADILGSGIGGALGGIASEGLGAILGMFSDTRMKTNIEEVSRDGPFIFYQWDWLPEVKALGLPLMDVGLLAQDVQKIAPEYVHEVDIGAKENILTIDYKGLFEDSRTWH